MRLMKTVKTTAMLDWREVVCRTAGVLVLLAGIFLGAELCVASPPVDHQITRIFDAPSTPALHTFSLGR